MAAADVPVLDGILDAAGASVSKCDAGAMESWIKDFPSGCAAFAFRHIGKVARGWGYQADKTLSPLSGSRGPAASSI
jgi:hypothetical protein